MKPLLGLKSSTLLILREAHEGLEKHLEEAVNHVPSIFIIVLAFRLLEFRHARLSSAHLRVSLMMRSHIRLQSTTYLNRTRTVARARHAALHGGRITLLSLIPKPKEYPRPVGPLELIIGKPIMLADLDEAIAISLPLLDNSGFSGSALSRPVFVSSIPMANSVKPFPPRASSSAPAPARALTPSVQRYSFKRMR